MRAILSLAFIPPNPHPDASVLTLSPLTDRAQTCGDYTAHPACPEDITCTRWLACMMSMRGESRSGRDVASLCMRHPCKSRSPKCFACALRIASDLCMDRMVQSQNPPKGSQTLRRPINPPVKWSVSVQVCRRYILTADLTVSRRFFQNTPTTPPQTHV